MSGAIFGPFGAFESLVGMMVFGAVSGVSDSLLNQAVEGEFSLGQTLLDDLWVQQQQEYYMEQEKL